MAPQKKDKKQKTRPQVWKQTHDTAIWSGKKQDDQKTKSRDGRSRGLRTKQRHTQPKDWRNESWHRDAMKKHFTPGHDPSIPWHGFDALYRRLRLKDMLKHGYINHLSGEFPAEEYFQARVPSHNQAAEFSGLPSPPTTPARYPKTSTDAHSGDAYSFIHPIFKRDNWRETSDADYETMTPSLRLASSLLCEPVVLHYFSALLGPLETIHDPEGEAVLKGPVRVFGLSQQPSFETAAQSGVEDALSETLTATMKTLIRMQDHLTFIPRRASGKVGANAWCVTRTDASRPGLVE